jgi:hypothetical protein
MKDSGLDEWEKSTQEMPEVIRADGGEWEGPWEEERGVLITELGHVVDTLRKDETTKTVNRIEVRATLLVPGLLPAIESDTFSSSSNLYGHGSRIASKSP